MGTKTHDPNAIIVVIGPHIMSGPAKGSFVKVSRAEESFKLTVGADGEPTRVRNRNRSGSLEVTLTRSSPTNDFLSALLLLDEQLGTGVVPVLVKDLNGATLHSAGEAWVEKPADFEGSDEATHLVWKIAIAKLVMFNGGLVS
jgi:hypothetical protein